MTQEPPKMFIGTSVYGTIARPLIRDLSTIKLPVTLVLLLTMFPRGPPRMGPTLVHLFRLLL